MPTPTATSDSGATQLLLHSKFFAQAETRPSAPALTVGETTLTYADLAQRASRVAGLLSAAGVGPEDRVALFTERSVEMVVGLLGILRSGGTYVPMDPAYPADRLAFMLADSGAGVALVEAATRQRLPTAFQGAVIELGGLEVAGDGVLPEPPTAQSLAYLIYTSGSTGVPKGVAIEHRQAAAMVAWAQSLFSPEELASVLAATSVCFDLSVFELLVTLSSGGEVVLADDALALPRLPAASRVTLVNTVPSAMAELMRARALPAAVKTVNLAGEPLPRPLADDIYGQGSVEKLYNLYGPSEDTTYSTWALIDRGAGKPPIGRPVAGTQAFVVGPDLRLVPDGDEGELCLAGAGVARGYFRRPALTAERFLPCPVVGAGERWYRTGDLVRRREDGELEFLGRLDHQVKIRGFRIELGEIESRLLSHPQVRDAVVTARSAPSGERDLVAYWVAEGVDGSPTREHLDGLRDHLAATLPAYMVPTTFVALDELPRTPNGKVDRQALPAPSRRRPPTRAAFVAPRNDLEGRIAALWCDLLDLDEVGVDDDLFELGGHSLLATRMVSRLREQFGREIPLELVFAQPTVADLAKEISDGPERRPVESIAPVPRGGDLPPSAAQERIWFLQQLEPDSLAYYFQGTIRLRGALDVPALEAAISEIVRRHEIFRTTFPTVDGEPVQRVHPAVPITLPVIDLAAEADPEAALAERIWERTQQHMDLARLPLIDWLLYRLSDDDHLLLQVEHHLLHDGWSFNVLLGELAEVYRASLAGEEPLLPELAIQFGDFAAWQKDWGASAHARQQLDYWRDRLGDSPPVLDLPSDRPRPARQSFRGSAERIRLGAELAEQVREVGRRHGVTLFQTLFAAYVTLLHRYSGQPEINIGCGIANRRLRDTERLIGMVINTVVLRADLAGDPSFSEFLERVRETTREAYAHQDLPFERIVEALRPSRSLSRNPFFQTAFSFHDAPLSGFDLPGIECEVTPAISNGSAKFDLNIITIPWREQRLGSGRGDEVRDIEMIWEYSSDMFERSTVQRIVSHFKALLAGLAENADRPLSAFPLLSEGEREQLSAWNRTATDFPRQATLADLFEAQAAATPEALAVVDGDRELTYGELDRQANGLAWRLREAGIEGEAPVAFCLERGAAAVTTMLAILKAGGCYVPLDTDYPEERLRWMLADSGATVLVGAGETARGLVGSGVELIDFEHEVPRARADGPPRRGFPEALAYMVYTSGSTGTPKGVAIPQQAVVRLVRDTDYVTLGAADRIAQVSNLSFDAATFEVWGALLNGARLVIVSRGDSLSPADLMARFAATGVNTAFLTTALFHQIAYHDPAAFRGLDQVLFGGETCDPERVRAVLAAGPPRRLLHVYGPTEVTTFTTWQEVGEVAAEAATVPIGQALANTTVHVLDELMSPLPVGALGELYAGGEGLARGYHRRPALTAERFRPNPVGEAGSRLYRTGDRVRRLADGAIDFLGRSDGQVKIRGFRIEVGEVEAALARLPGVREAVVMARSDAGDLRLVAYWVPEVTAADAELPAVTAADLRAALSTRLPDYMMPAAFVTLEALPWNANGKVDRDALPAPDAAALASADYLAPRDEVEELLADVWSGLIGVDRVGVRDNFFEIGGHSLHATRHMHRLQDLLGIDLPIRALYEAPTVEQMARRVEAGLAAAFGVGDAS
ncbi:MAG: amino acid adenylation domain-containing protein [Acidobacteriota bacterium]